MAKKPTIGDAGGARGKSQAAGARTTGSQPRKEAGMPGDDKPRNADFIGRMVSDPKNPPEARMLTGWFGDAAAEGYRRLYTDAALCAYVDIPTDAILYSEPIRDVQPAGGVFVWVRRDTTLKPGGSAASRAARFLQGQVQQDFASGSLDLSSPEKAGYRCVTQPPCGEPTGFTGQCTKQPEVGGAWPCITAIPHCSEPTGFTGQCTHQPWPLPTRYIGCTFLHCPTQDLTHVPHICNIVATGVAGCPVVDPRGGGDPAARVGLAAEAEAGREGGGSPAERAAVPATSIPGCGYTETWGLCETHLLGCGFTEHWGQQCPTQLPGCGQTKDCPTTVPGCGWSKNPICTDLPGCGWTQQWGLCQHTQPPKCNVSVDIPCITQDNACGVTRNPACFANLGGGGFAAFRAAAPGVPINTQLPLCHVSAAAGCNPSTVDACPTRLCDTQPPTAFCTQFSAACPTNPQFCPPTQHAQDCPTFCGVHCQTQQDVCTKLNCTHAGPQCPSVGIACTAFAQECPRPIAAADRFGGQDTTDWCPPWLTQIYNVCALALPTRGVDCIFTNNANCPPTSWQCQSGGCPTPACPPHTGIHPLHCAILTPNLRFGLESQVAVCTPAAAQQRGQAFAAFGAAQPAAGGSLRGTLFVGCGATHYPCNPHTAWWRDCRYPY